MRLCEGWLAIAVDKPLLPALARTVPPRRQERLLARCAWSQGWHDVETNFRVVAPLRKKCSAVHTATTWYNFTESEQVSATSGVRRTRRVGGVVEFKNIARPFQRIRGAAGLWTGTAFAAARHAQRAEPTLHSGQWRLPQPAAAVASPYGPTKTDFPGVVFERQVVVQGNAILEAFARNESAARGGGVLYLDRSAAMHGAKYMDTVSSLQSPCFHFHPYGVLTDVHVSLGLEALASYTLGGQGQDRQSRGRQGWGGQGFAL